LTLVSAMISAMTWVNSASPLQISIESGLGTSQPVYVQRVTGAERVAIFDHIVRNSLLAERGEKGARSPAKFVHNDYTFKSAPRRVRDLLPEEADRLLKSRFAEINVWRAIRGPDRKLTSRAVRRPQPRDRGYRAD
jgi:hypothetical protein